MMKRQTHTITFRGESAEVIFEDHGHERNCNAHVIEWWFADIEMNDLKLTDQEEQAIYDQLLSVCDGE